MLEESESALPVLFFPINSNPKDSCEDWYKREIG